LKKKDLDVEEKDKKKGSGVEVSTHHHLNIFAQKH